MHTIIAFINNTHRYLVAKSKNIFTAIFVIVLGVVGVFTTMKKFFHVDLLDDINKSVAKKAFAEAYGICAFQSQNTDITNPNFDFSSDATNLSINSSTAASLPFDFYYTGKKYNSIYLNNTQLFNISPSTQNAISSSFSFDGLGANSKSYFTNEVRSGAYRSRAYFGVSNYSWNLGLPIDNTNNFKIDSLKTKAFGTAPNRTFGAQFDISPSQAAPGPVDRIYADREPFNSPTYTAGEWDWNNRTVITDGQPTDIYVLQDKGDINLDNVSIVNITVNGTKGSAVKDSSNKKIIYTPNLGETGDDNFTYTYTDGNGNISTETVTVKLGSISSNIATLDGSSYSSTVFHDDIVVVNPTQSTIKFNPFRNDILNQTSNSYSIKLYLPGGGFTPNLYTGDGTDTVVNRAIINADHSIEINTTDIGAGEDLRYTVYDQNNTFLGEGRINLVVLPQNNIQHGIALQEDTGSFASYTNTANEVILGSGNTAIYEQNIEANSKGFGYSISQLNNEYNLQLRYTRNINQMVYIDQLNCPVSAQADNASVALGSSVDIPVLANDADFEYYRSGVDSPLTVTIDSTPINGTATVNPDMTIKFTPTTPYSGNGYFSYIVGDIGHYGQLTNGAVADVYINIDNTAVNQPPTVSSFSKSTAQDTTLAFTSSDFTTHYNDNENDPLNKIKITQLPIHGTLKLSGNNIVLSQEISSADLVNITYVPNTGYSGSDLVKWNASDGTDYATTDANINITIVYQNLPPTANLDNTSTNYNTPKIIDVITNDTDPEDPNNLITVCLASLSSTDGTVTLGSNNRSITFTPTTNSLSPGSFTYKACDSQGLESLPVTSVVTINNQPPTVSDFAKTTNQDTTLNFTSLDFSSNYSDPENSALSKVKITQLPTNGNLKLNVNANVALDQEISSTDLVNISYIPNTGYSGSDLVKWNANDGTDYATTDANINITVTPVVVVPPVNQRPTANPDNFSTNYKKSKVIDIVTNDTDPEDNNSLLKVCANSLSAIIGGTLVLGSDNRTITFTPATNPPSSTTFTYKVCDSAGLESLPVTSNIDIILPKAVEVSIQKNKQDKDIFVNTNVGVEVKTTNPNPFAEDVVNIVKIDSTKLKLVQNSAKEGVLSDLGNLAFINNSFFDIKASAQDANPATIEIISTDTIKVTYSQMPPNSSKSIVFVTTSLVTGNTEVKSTANLVSYPLESNAKLPLASQPIVLQYLPRTGGDRMILVLASMIGVGVIAFAYININQRRKLKVYVSDETENKMIEDDY